MISNIYPMISNRLASNDDIMESSAKQIGTDFVTLEFSNSADFEDVFTSKPGKLRSFDRQ